MAESIHDILQGPAFPPVLLSCPALLAEDLVKEWCDDQDISEAMAPETEPEAKE